MIRAFIAFGLCLAAFAAPTASALSDADVRRCNAMAATMAPKKARVAALQAKRDEISARVEALREEWESSESMRLIDGEQAEKADALNTQYEAALMDLDNAERAMQGEVVMFNKSVSAYNSSCASE